MSRNATFIVLRIACPGIEKASRWWYIDCQTKPNMKNLALVAAILFAILFHCVAAPTNGTGPTNGIELKQLARQYLPGCAFKPPTAAKPRELVSATGETLDLLAALREKQEPRKSAGYWLTPTMAFLSRQRIEAGTGNDAAGVVRLLHLICHGPEFVKLRIYRALPFEGGWVVEVDRQATNGPGIVPALPPYELLVDAGQRVAQIRERCYPYSGSARVYEATVRSVYEREMKLNGGRNYPAALEIALAKAWEAEKAQKTVKPAPAPGK